MAMNKEAQAKLIILATIMNMPKPSYGGKPHRKNPK
jgi:hypothetical protein